jgi:hypothetical protein
MLMHRRESLTNGPALCKVRRITVILRECRENTHRSTMSFGIGIGIVADITTAGLGLDLKGTMIPKE